MSTLTSDARGFVTSVVKYLEDDGKKSGAIRVQTLLTRVSAQAKREKSAHVVTAIALVPPERERVQHLVEKLLGHRVEVSYVVDRGVLGGIRIQVADWIVDTTLSGQIQELQVLLLS